MTDIVRYRDGEGLINYSARQSKQTADGLASGEYVEVDQQGNDIPLPSSPTDLVEPPRGGSGSGIEAWREYAMAVGVDLADDMNRDEVIAAVDALKEADGEAAQHGEDHKSGGDLDRSGDGQGASGPADGNDGGRPDQSGVGR